MSLSLKVDYCSFEAAKFSVENYHYSQRMPAGKLVKFGVWENGEFIGSVIYGRGANNNAAQSFGLKTTECCELVRVALREHETPVTRIISISLKLLKKDNPGIKLVFSYADETNQGHKGIIYKAGNWEYLGKRVSQGGHFIINGRLVHNRTLSSRFGSRENIPESYRKKMQKAPKQVKHLFIYRLEKMRG